MGKTVEEICNLLVCKNNIASNLAANSIRENVKTLSSTLEYINENDCLSGFSDFYINNDGLDFKTRRIASELAFAIDRNSIEKIRFLKKKYGNLKEFARAKDFLNEKCKQIWSVYESNKNLPKDAMKALGITNQPDLKTLFKESLNLSFQDEGQSLLYLIKSILNNKNMSYTIDDIYLYLLNLHNKDGLNFGLPVAQYLIEKHNYSKNKLEDLGIKFKDIRAFYFRNRMRKIFSLHI